jgi:hypothetical protein
MVANLGAFAQAAATHLIALSILWGVLVASSYVMVHWCLKKNMEWVRAAQYISVAMGLVFLCVVALYLLPEAWTVPLTKVIVPRLVCAAVLHSLILAVDRYMRHRYADGIIPTRLVVSIIGIYAISLLGSFLLLKINNLLLIEISDIATDYLTKGAIVGLLFLEVIGGRCKDQPDEGSGEVDYTKRW